MAQVTISPDLTYYYADLNRLPRLSDEEQRQLLTPTAHLDVQVRNRLVESYLRFATGIVVHHAPFALPDLLPDIIGEVSLTLITIMQWPHVHTISNLYPYITACVRRTIRSTIGQSKHITVPSDVLLKAKQQGVEHTLYQLEPFSLDACFQEDDADERCDEPLVTPLLPTTEAPPRDPMLRAQIQHWLSYLSPRAQRVLTLRYGLSDEDERARATIEVARELGMTYRSVQSVERDALLRLRALAEGRATLM